MIFITKDYKKIKSKTKMFYNESLEQTCQRQWKIDKPQRPRKQDGFTNLKQVTVTSGKVRGAFNKFPDCFCAGI